MAHKKLQIKYKINNKLQNNYLTLELVSVCIDKKMQGSLVIKATAGEVEISVCFTSVYSYYFNSPSLFYEFCNIIPFKKNT